MIPAERVVTAIPVRELWDPQGTLPLTRSRLLSASDLKAQLRTHSVRFAVADTGLPLRWVEPRDAANFWKREVQPRLIDPTATEAGFTPDSFPGGYAYIASEWSLDNAPAAVLLEKYH
jgi:hypothetical protein